MMKENEVTNPIEMVPMIAIGMLRSGFGTSSAI